MLHLLYERLWYVYSCKLYSILLYMELRFRHFFLNEFSGSGVGILRITPAKSAA